ncbi:DsbA family oxidoreductase [Candidatus Enterococcus clewellii]|uniref:DSBA-like thioredoxin domain-containing protein n=1 Tax=Candidatus Enterococcus clewellii TaxID=1834193 RepID=A0A242K4U4_9ENTE|nr:DsbA family protein [Enterococcus sp. 9E7_DIV0242]OTP14352.1 hypothetical protein A5888_002453 [Enterococcus sp. 9E7_DIV0242]
MLRIEFFHDVICSFCFPMSARLRAIVRELSNVEVVHKSFALGWTEEDFIQMFGSRKQVKPEVLTHWAHANENDEQHRFNIEGMRAESFDFPTSRNGLLAAKAAGLVGGQMMYWEVFDKLQEGLFVQNKNIEDPSVIESLVKQTSIDFDEWQSQFAAPETVQAVEEDFRLAQTYNLQGVPALIVNEKYLISGAQPAEVILDNLKKIAEKEQTTIQLEVMGDNKAACQLEDGKWACE